MKPTQLWLMRGGKTRPARPDQTPDLSNLSGQTLEQKPQTPSPETKSEAETEAEALWQRARLSAAQRLASPLEAPKPSLPASSPYESLEALSDEVHSVLAAREEAAAPQMASGFAVIHSRLMQAISASRELPALPGSSGSLGSSAAAGQNSGKKAGEARWRLRSGQATSRSWARSWAVSWCAASFVAVAAGAGGHHLGRMNAGRLPADTMISDFDGSLKSSAPLPLLGQNSSAAASWLGRNTGIKVRLPAPGKSGVRLIGARFIGARSRATGGQPIAQTHYERRGVRLALYQMHAPGIGLDGLDQQIVRGRSFFVHSAGAYRLVAWRNGENVMAVVSPLDPAAAVRLADEMRDDVLEG